MERKVGDSFRKKGNGRHLKVYALFKECRYYFWDNVMPIKTLMRIVKLSDLYFKSSLWSLCRKLIKEDERESRETNKEAIVVI